jgi:hypothetical protein
LPFRREDELGVRVSVPDLIGARERGEVVSRRTEGEPIVEALEGFDGLEGVTLVPFRIV